MTAAKTIAFVLAASTALSAGQQMRFEDVVRNLRKKIEFDPTRPRILLTELGVGYRLGP